MTPKKPSASEKDHQSPAEHPQVEKKSYKKPAFRSERVFETMALNCGKIAIQNQCRHKRRAS